MSYLADQVKGKSTDFIVGFKLGLLAFAHWKDGVMYLGTCGTTVKQAMAEIQEQELKDAEAKLDLIHEPETEGV